MDLQLSMVFFFKLLISVIILSFPNISNIISCTLFIYVFVFVSQQFVYAYVNKLVVSDFATILFASPRRPTNLAGLT